MKRLILLMLVLFIFIAPSVNSDDRYIYVDRYETGVPISYEFKALSQYKYGNIVRYWNYSRIMFLHNSLPTSIQAKIKGYPSVIVGNKGPHHYIYVDPFNRVELTGGIKKRHQIGDPLMFAYLKKLDAILAGHPTLALPDSFPKRDYSELKEEIKIIWLNEKNGLSIFQQARSQYPSLLDNNMPRAKIMYVYLQKLIKRMSDDLSKLENIGMLSTNADIQSRVEIALVSCLEIYTEASTIYNEFNQRIMRKTDNAKLIEELDKFDIRLDIPFYKVKDGSYDSDSNGVADEKEFGVKQQEVSSDIINRTVTMRVGGWYDFQSGTSSSGGSGLAVALGFFGNPGRMKMALHGGDLYNLGTDVYRKLPKNGYSGLFYYNIIPGNVLGMFYAPNNYVKIRIISVVPRTSVTFEYWYKEDGGVF